MAIRKYCEKRKEFIEDLKPQKGSQDYKMVSFDVKSLFTKKPLDHTIDIILRRINKNEIVTSITK